MIEDPKTLETNEVEQDYEDQRESVGGIIEHARYLEKERDELNDVLKIYLAHIRKQDIEIYELRSIVRGLNTSQDKAL